MSISLLFILDKEKPPFPDANYSLSDKLSGAYALASLFLFIPFVFIFIWYQIIFEFENFFSFKYFLHYTILFIQ